MSRFANKRSGIINSMDLKRPQVRFLYWLIFFLLILLVLICVLPPLWVILSSMKDLKEFLQVPPTILPKSFHPEKLGQVWKMLDFGKYYLNTLILAAGNVVFSITLNGLAGYVLSRLKPKGSTLVFTLMLWTLMLPNSVSMVPVFKNIVNVPLLHINLTDSYIPMWLMAGASAFNVMVFKSFFDGIPKSLIEAARLDGCSDLGIFFRIVVPLSVPYDHADPYGGRYMEKFLLALSYSEKPGHVYRYGKDIYHGRQRFQLHHRSPDDCPDFFHYSAGYLVFVLPEVYNGRVHFKRNKGLTESSSNENGRNNTIWGIRQMQ